VTVAELIAKLSEFDQSLPVTYCDESQEYPPDPQLASKIWAPFANGYISPRAKPERVVL
jgi:hypothetical protein